MQITNYKNYHELIQVNSHYQFKFWFISLFSSTFVIKPTKACLLVNNFLPIQAFICEKRLNKEMVLIVGNTKLLLASYFPYYHWPNTLFFQKRWMTFTHILVLPIMDFVSIMHILSLCTMCIACNKDFPCLTSSSYVYKSQMQDLLIMN